MLDFALAVAVPLSLVLIPAAYAIRRRKRGDVHYDRVDRIGGSALVGKRWLEMGYWAMQPLARFCVKSHVTANALSGASLLMGVGAGAMLALGRFGTAALLLVAASVCDALDGFVARATGTACVAGALFDATADRYNEFFFFVGLALYYSDRRPVLMLVLAALVGSFMVSYASAKGEALAQGAPRGAMRRHERLVYLVLGTALTAISMHVGWPSGRAEVPLFFALAMVAVIANASAVHRFWVMGHRAPIAAVASVPETPPVQTTSPKSISGIRASVRTR